jgi:cytochrome b
MSFAELIRQGDLFFPEPAYQKRDCCQAISHQMARLHSFAPDHSERFSLVLRVLAGREIVQAVQTRQGWLTIDAVSCCQALRGTGVLPSLARKVGFRTS